MTTLDRFKKYENYKHRNYYWGKFNPENKEDKLLLLIEQFFFVLDKETEVNNFTHANDRVPPLENTQNYLKNLLIKILEMQKDLIQEDISKLCKVYSLFIMNKGLDTNMRELVFPITSVSEFEENSFGCSITFLLMKYFCKNTFLYLDDNEKIDFEEYLNKKMIDKSEERKKETYNKNVIEEYCLIRKELSKFIEFVAEEENIDMDKFVYFFLKNESEKFLSISFGMDFLNKGLSNEKNKGLLDYCLTENIPRVFYNIKEEHKDMGLVKDIFGKLPEGLFEKPVYNFKKIRDQIDSISKVLPDVYKIYRTEQLNNKLTVENTSLRKKRKI